MSDSLFHFFTKSRFVFVFKEQRSPSIGSAQVSHILREIADAFLTEFPLAAEWAGDIEKCASFASTCDKILQLHPLRRGIPVLFRITGETLFLDTYVASRAYIPWKWRNSLWIAISLAQIYWAFQAKKFSVLFSTPFSCTSLAQNGLLISLRFTLIVVTSQYLTFFATLPKNRIGLPSTSWSRFSPSAPSWIVPEIASYLQRLRIKPSPRRNMAKSRPDSGYHIRLGRLKSIH